MPKPQEPTRRSTRRAVEPSTNGQQPPLTRDRFFRSLEKVVKKLPKDPPRRQRAS